MDDLQINTHVSYFVASNPYSTDGNNNKRWKCLTIVHIFHITNQKTTNYYSVAETELKYKLLFLLFYILLQYQYR